MIAFIILHYKNIKDTIECLESIKKLDDQEKIKIIVVDNHTLDSQEKKQIEKYTKDIILLEDNLGFAKANNKGCKYAKKKYNPDYLCVINSDVEINQHDFIKKIYDIDQKYHFDVLGPKILPEELPSCNPFPVYSDLETVKNKIKYTKKLIKIYKNPLLRFLLKGYIYIKAKVTSTPTIKNGNKMAKNVALHGCGLIFSKKYYQKYDDVFYNETFLFHEEEFLYQRCIRDNLVFLYHPELRIIHKEGSSLDREFEHEKYKKLIFKNEEILKSLYLLENVIEKGKKI